MTDIADINIELLILQGRTAEALAMIRKRNHISGRLLQMLCDLADPDKLRKMGRPIERETWEYKASQRLMIFEFYFLRFYYKTQGRKNPAQLAKDAVIEAHGKYKDFFEKAHKRYGNQYRKQVELHLELMTDRGLEFPDWVKNYNQ